MRRVRVDGEVVGRDSRDIKNQGDVDVDVDVGR